MKGIREILWTVFKNIGHRGWFQFHMLPKKLFTSHLMSQAKGFNIKMGEFKWQLFSGQYAAVMFIITD